MAVLVLCIAAVLLSVKRKQFWSIPTACLIFLYVVLELRLRETDFLNQSGSALQILVLLLLTGYAVFATIKSNDGKRGIVVAVSAVIACIFRFIRRFHYDVLVRKLQEPGADSVSILEKFSVVQSVADFVVVAALLLILYVILKKSGKQEKRN